MSERRVRVDPFGSNSVFSINAFATEMKSIAVRHRHDDHSLNRSGHDFAPVIKFARLRQ
jgi:hypothetical protein